MYKAGQDNLANLASASKIQYFQIDLLMNISFEAKLNKSR